MSLKKFERNIQSQFGEDGVIEEIFKRIGNQNKICIEFGAWDGIHLSNTWNLWSNHDWSALLIEGVSDKFDTLVANTKSFAKVKPLNVFVTLNGENSLDSIFTRVGFPTDIDLLSIDIDSDDYYIFENLKNYRPRLVVVEYNPTIPPHLEIVQQPGDYYGCSALALHKLAKLKRYQLVHMTDTNMFFVRSEDFDKMNVNESELYNLFPFQNLTNVLSSYDGQTFINRMPVYAKRMESDKPKPNRITTLFNGEVKEELKLSPTGLIPVKILRKEGKIDSAKL